jgi:hypothetical protein
MKDGIREGITLFSLAADAIAARQKCRQKQMQTFTQSVGSQYPLRTFKSRKRKKARNDVNDQKKSRRK